MTLQKRWKFLDNMLKILDPNTKRRQSCLTCLGESVIENIQRIRHSTDMMLMNSIMCSARTWMCENERTKFDLSGFFTPSSPLALKRCLDLNNSPKDVERADARAARPRTHRRDQRKVRRRAAHNRDLPQRLV